MAYELGLSDAGLVMPRTADYLDEVRARYESITELEVDWANDLVLGTFADIAAQLLGEQAEVVQAIYDAWDPNNATGVQMSNIARINGVTRERATKAQATVTCTGTPGTAITIGKMVEGGGSDGRARWIVTEDVLIPADGTVDVVVQAEVAGRTVAIEGELATIVTPTTGWASVTNAEAASPGTDAETDAELRIRRVQSIQLSAGIGIGAMRAALLGLDYIDAVAVIDNPDNEDKVVEGIAMLAHSYLVIILPDTLTTDQKEEIGRLIYDKTPVSVRHSATDEVLTVTGEDGFDKEVGFDYAAEIAANIAADLTMRAGYSIADAGAALRVLVEAYIATLQIGDDLHELKLQGFASSVPGVIGAEFLINGSPSLVTTAIQRVVVGTWAVT